MSLLRECHFKIFAYCYFHADIWWSVSLYCKLKLVTTPCCPNFYCSHTLAYHTRYILSFILLSLPRFKSLWCISKCEKVCLLVYRGLAVFCRHSCFLHCPWTDHLKLSVRFAPLYFVAMNFIFLLKNEWLWLFILNNFIKFTVK